MANSKQKVQNFGKIKSAFNTILAESVVTKDDSKKILFKKYVSLLKENEILKTQFLVFTNIEAKVESDASKATHFVTENISLFSKYNEKDILAANEKLISLLGENAVDVSSELHDEITKLIFTKKGPNTIDAIVEATGKVVNYITKNQTPEAVAPIELPNSLLSTIMVEKYNQKYSTLDESDKKILKALISSTDDEKKVVYTEMIRECIDLIDQKLGTSDLDAKDKMLKVKDKLLRNKIEVDDDFGKNISKLSDLKNSLKNN